MDFLPANELKKMNVCLKNYGKNEVLRKILIMRTKSLYFLVFRSVTKISPCSSCFRRITFRLSKSSVLKKRPRKSELTLISCSVQAEILSFLFFVNKFGQKQQKRRKTIFFFFVSYKENETQSTYSLSPAIVIVSKNKFGSLCSLASLCQFAKNSMGFSGAFSMNDKPDDSIFLVSLLTQIWSVSLVSRLNTQCSA